MTHRLIRLAGALVGLSLSGALAASSPTFAADDAMHPEHHHWHFAGVFGTFDRAAMQRGYQVYREVCAACHSMKFMAFRNLGQEGGPFYDPEYPNPNDNPVIKALAAEFTVTDGPDDAGDMFERPGRPSDPFPSPFPNDPAARAVNGGALPPDLSVIIKARHDGSNYVRSLLTGFIEPPDDVTVAPGMHYNPWFPGGQIAMAPPLPEDRVTYEDGTLATTEQMAEDVVEFLTWAADPHAEVRKRMGFKVIIYLGVLTILLWFSYRQIWRDVKH